MNFGLRPKSATTCPHQHGSCANPARDSGAGTGAGIGGDETADGGGAEIERAVRIWRVAFVGNSEDGVKIAFGAEISMKLSFRFRWLWLALFFGMIVGGALVFLRQSMVNPMHPALDKLSAVKFSERWSHPEMMKIRALGVKAVPSLRRMLREKDSPTTRFLLWVKRPCPGVTKFYSHFPDVNKMWNAVTLPV